MSSWPPRRGTDTDEPLVYRDIPAAELPLLHINAVLENGKVVKTGGSPWGFEQKRTFTADFSRHNLTVFHRFETDKAGELIVPDRTGNLKNEPEGDTLFVGVGKADDPYACIVPCAEILRFFYATSSAMVRAILTDEFLDPNRNLWDVNKSHILPNGDAFIQLRKRTLDADARFFARFAFDRYAQFQAREIFLYAAGRRREQDSRIIRALPPYEGKTKLAANVIPIRRAFGERLLVTRLLTSDWRPPFAKLGHLRDNDGREDDGNLEEREHRAWPKNTDKPRIPVPGVPPEEITLTGDPASTALKPWSLEEEEINERFPELAKVPVEKLHRKEATTRGDDQPVRRVANPEGKGSVDGAKSSADLIAQVLITGLEMMVPPKKGVADDVDPDAGDGAYRRTAALLGLLRAQHLAAVEFLVATDQAAYVDEVPCCVFPDDHDEEKTAWLYVDKEKTHRRLVLVASIEKSGRVRYIIDIQHKIANESSMVLLWNREESELPIGFLSQALHGCAEAKGASLKTVTYLGLRWNRLKHTAKKATEEEAKRLLKRVFSAKAVSNDNTEEEK